MDYLQPDFYRFNVDSLKLVKLICEHHPKASFLLDAGAGCGVIGIELAQKIPVEEVHFLEVQREFSSYLQKNIELFIPKTKYSISISSFLDFKSERRFDLIVCNPPYYLPGRGQPNTDPRRGICRSFQIDSWNVLLNLFTSYLSDEGSAWVVIKNDDHLLKLIESENKTLKMKVKMVDDLYLIQFTLPTECKC